MNLQNRTKIPGGWLILLILALTGCAPLIRPEQTAGQATLQLKQGKTVGQTFVARYAGLTAIEILLTPGQTPDDMYFHLQTEPGAAGEIASGRVPLNGQDTPTYVRFPFPPQDSNQAYYYFWLETDSPDPIHIAHDRARTYLHGAAYRNHEPVTAQLAFRLVYDPVWVARGLLGEGAVWLGMVLLTGVLFTLPGWALLRALYPGWASRGWEEKLALAGGVSLALYPILLAWTDVVGLRMGAAYAWGPPILAAGYLIWAHRAIPARFGLPNPGRNRGFGNPLRAGLIQLMLLIRRPQTLILLLILMLLFATRFWAIRSLETGMWGDSYQHTLIAQLLVDHGGLFDSWQPYIDLTSFTYHFGFHTSAALLHWLTGMGAAKSVLWAGQIINVLAVFALLPLTNKVGGNRWAGVGAVLLAGLLINMPSFYVNWGRYTQLTGQAILPVTVFLAWDLFAREGRLHGFRVLTGLVFAGLAMTHYRVIIMAGCFFPAYALLNVRQTSWRRVFGHALGFGVTAGVLFAPWFINVFAGKLVDFLSATLSSSAGISQTLKNLNRIDDLTRYLPPVVWVGMFGTLGWGLWRRSRGAALIGAWWLVILLAANPGWVGLPGTGALNNMSAFIAIYIPAGLLLGAGLGWGVGSGEWGVARGRWQGAGGKGQGARGKMILSVVLVGLAVWGARARMSDVDFGKHTMVTRPDVRAAAWIDQHLDPDARFLVNSFFAFGESSVVGADAGWWLPWLAHRATTLPPLVYVSEAGPRPDTIAWVNALTDAIRSNGVTHPDVIAELGARGVTHVYIGQQQGRVNWNGKTLDTKILLTDPNFRPVYHEDRVWIFELRR